MRPMILSSIVLLVALTVTGETGAQLPDPRPGPSAPVTIVNLTPIPVTVPGGITVSGSVNIANTPSVNVANTPSVIIANTPVVQSVQSGTWNVGVTTPVSLAAGATVKATPTAPQQPYVFAQDRATGPVQNGLHSERVFGPAGPSIRIALTTVVFANASNRSWFIPLYSDDCNGNNRVQYLYPIVPQETTFTVSFSSPLVIASAGTWCLNVGIPDDGALYPFTLVGYVM